ncbi:hypothetical protein C8Q78DRAFT_312506 [Trametes maxima]|nr:hypothetical protein C8Q78DRAFT_312506 [Trametes maxima]
MTSSTPTVSLHGCGICALSIKYRSLCEVPSECLEPNSSHLLQRTFAAWHLRGGDTTVFKFSTARTQSQGYINIIRNLCGRISFTATPTHLPPQKHYLEFPTYVDVIEWRSTQRRLPTSSANGHATTAYAYSGLCSSHISKEWHELVTQQARMPWAPWWDGIQAYPRGLSSSRLTSGKSLAVGGFAPSHSDASWRPATTLLGGMGNVLQASVCFAVV